MLEGSCDCGAVHIELDDTPADVTHCNCGICRRYGALWSYFHRVPSLHGMRLRHPLGSIDQRYPRMGVNMRLFPPEIVARLEVVLCDAASW